MPRAVRSQLEASSAGLATEPAVSRQTPFPSKKSKNGNSGGPGSLDMRILLQAMQAMRDGDFSVRLPGDCDGLAGKIADAFNDIVAANERMAQQLERVGEVVGRRARPASASSFGVAERRLGRDGRLGQHADRRPALADDAGDARASPPWRRATCCRPCRSKSTAAR